MTQRETCESCERYLSENETGHTLCNTCAAGRYWALKEHIRDKLQFFAKLPAKKNVLLEYEKCTRCDGQLGSTAERDVGLCIGCYKEIQDALKAFKQTIYQYNTNYVAGRNFEYRLKDKLEDAGYFVIRAAGSHGAADLIAIKGGVVYLIQCKRDFRPLTSEEKQKLLEPCTIAQDTTNNKPVYYDYIVPVHAKLFNKAFSAVDLRDNREVKLF